MRYSNDVRVFLLIAASLGLTGSATRAASPVRVPSPDEKVEFVVEDSDAGPLFGVRMDGKVLSADSPLGVELHESGPIGPGLRLGQTESQIRDETWTPVWGTQSPVRDHCREATVAFTGAIPGDLRIALVVRAYNDGVAFRYRIEGKGEVQIAEERTAFNLAEDAKAFALPLKNFNTGYEAPYTIDQVSKLGKELLALPLTLEFPGGHWAAITEAHLDDYAGLYLESQEEDRLTLKTRLSGAGGKPRVVREAPFETPWRVILLGRRPGDLITSNIIVNCNPPSAIEDTSWIKPGKVIWDWWCKQMVNGVDFEGGMNTETMLHFAKFAAESGIDYLLIDEGWSWWANLPGDDGKLRRVTDITRTVPEIDLPKILEYCHANGVQVWLWLTWGHCANQMDEAFPLYEKWGIAGVKIDFMNRDDQWMVNWYHKVAKEAAKHRLMVDMHGAYKPTGMRRTWPNMMTREGVLGLEHSKWSSNVTPEHNVLLPFTRMLAGPMDYTPGGFNVVTPDRFRHRDSAPFVMGTLCHQLAQYVIYESPIQMCVDYPDNYRGAIGFEFLQWVPTTWEKSIVIDGYPGEFIVMARRHGKDWYLGAMTNRTGRTVKVNLDFLGKGTWEADIFADGPRAKDVPEQIRRATRRVKASESLDVVLAPSGGYAARLRPVPADSER